MDNTLIAVIIPHYRNVEDTKCCVDSLKHSSLRDLVVIVVDDSRTDYEKLKKRIGKEENTEIICPKARRGFAGAVNDGFKAAVNYNPKFLMILNNDTVVEKHAIERLVEKCAPMDIVGPSIFRMDDMDEIWAYGLKLKMHRSSLNKLIKKIDFKNESKSPIDMVTGCAALFPQKAVDEIGYMDERYFLYLEDMDFFYRAKKRGYKFFIVKDSKIWHKGGGSSGGPESPEVIYYMTRNMLLFMKKHGKVGHLVVFFLIFFHHLFKRSVFFIQRRDWKGFEAMNLGIIDFVLSRYGQSKHTRLIREKP